MPNWQYVRSARHCSGLVSAAHVHVRRAGLRAADASNSGDYGDTGYREQRNECWQSHWQAPGSTCCWRRPRLASKPQLSRPVPAAIEQATDQALANGSANEAEHAGCETYDTGDNWRETCETSGAGGDRTHDRRIMRMVDRFPGSSACDNVAAIASALPSFAGFARFPLAQSLAASLQRSNASRESLHAGAQAPAHGL
jgi:hypothetical protein